MIYCPVHQIQENSKLDLSSFFKGFGEVHACKCKYCKKTYIDVRGIKSGVVGHTSKGYDVVNLHKYYSFPKSFYLVTKDQIKKLAQNNVLFEIPEFLVKNKLYRVKSFYEPSMQRYYINQECYKSCIDILDKFLIKIIDERHKTVFPYVYKYELLPNELYVLNSNEFEKIIRIKELMDISKFSDKSGHEYHISARYDQKSNKYYISDTMYKEIKCLEAEGKIKIYTFKNLKVNESISKMHQLPRIFYVLKDEELQKLEVKENLIDHTGFKDSDHTYFYIPSRCNKGKTRFYINTKTYEKNISLFKKHKIQRVDFLRYKEKDIVVKHELPKKIYVLNETEIQKLNSILNVHEVKRFKNTEYSFYEIPTMYDPTNKVYFVESGFVKKYSKILNFLEIHLIKNKTFSFVKRTFKKPRKLNQNKFDLEDKFELNVNQPPNIFNKDRYVDKLVWNFTYGKGKFVKLIGTTVFVDHNGNLQSYDFPECFITDTLRFVDKEYQTSMMQEISRNELVQEKTSSYISKQSVTTQNSSYTDVRRIPGLVYKIQLIGSSNNHATRIHPVEDVVVKLAYKNPKSKTFDIVSIPMHYCSQCNKYFDMKQSFLQTLQKYNLDINYFAASFESETGHPIVFKQMDLREFSKLKLFGYSVGANGLSTGARHELLDFILKNHLMTASEIKSQLQFNIRFIGKKAHMDDAVGDWEKDIDYVNNYISSGKIHWRY